MPHTLHDLPRPSDFLDMMREQLDLPSDYAVAKLLGTTTQAISKYRHNRVGFSDETAAAVADALGIERGYVIACMQARNAASDVARETWLDLAARLAPAAALSLIFYLGLGVFSPDNMAFAALPFVGSESLYIMLTLAWLAMMFTPTGFLPRLGCFLGRCAAAVTRRAPPVA